MFGTITDMKRTIRIRLQLPLIHRLCIAQVFHWGVLRVVEFGISRRL